MPYSWHVWSYCRAPFQRRPGQAPRERKKTRNEKQDTRNNKRLFLYKGNKVYCLRQWQADGQTEQLCLLPFPAGEVVALMLK